MLTLRDYLVSKLSKSSKKRQRKLLRYGRNCTGGVEANSDASVAQLLDSTVVGSFNHAEIRDVESIDKDITIFTQQLSESDATISPTQGALQQSEVGIGIGLCISQTFYPLLSSSRTNASANHPQIVDFTVWLLFRRHQGPYKPPHVLCHGYQRYAAGHDNSAELAPVSGVPGVFSNNVNPHVQTLKEHPWNNLPSLLGKGSEGITSDMLVQCGIFQPVGSSSNLTQLSGLPLCELKALEPAQLPKEQNSPEENESEERKCPSGVSGGKRGLSDIRFVRHRILYAKPTSSAREKIHFGLNHAHVLNRYHDTNNEAETRHVMNYIFPRQSGLHNVFTSEIDPKDTAQHFKDYTMRDNEIASSNHRWRQRRQAGNETRCKSGPPLPKRLRGQVLHLVARLRKRHVRCSYASLLEHYCPSPLVASGDLNGSITQGTPASRVSALCRAAVQKVFPADFWGRNEIRTHNQGTIWRSIDKFVRIRRYESLSVHDVLQDIKIRGIQWLAPLNVDDGSRLSNTDFAKRTELMAELLYYVFDSFLIPLIRGHFHVTESGIHRNQLFYFRHDVWRAMSEPALSSLKDNMLQLCNTAEVKKRLATRALGVSQVRLLPKEQGMRPIINLRRRVQKVQHGQLVLGKSINSILTPTFTALNCEKSANPDLLGSALFSVDDMYPRLQSFRGALERQGLLGKPLYFAKVDVKGCFDTIPQKRLMSLARSILGADAYHTAKYARAKLVGGHNKETPGFGAKASWRYLTKATTDDDHFHFAREVEADAVDGRTRTIYVDVVNQKPERRKAILDLLEEHVESNLLKLGNRFYRQKQGIPQGSVLSSLLCSYFYAELEREVLGFIDDAKSTLLRLIDDFLVITTEKEVAEKFMRVMDKGVPEFGVEVKAEKSRTNFDLKIDGKSVARVPSKTDFPYCGNAINTVTLDLSKDEERRKKSSK